MKIGAKRMAYPGDNPENGPKYMQQWTGKEWMCFVHKPAYDEDSGDIRCKNCYEYICNTDGKRKK
jgi:hypothetical protein